MVSAGKRKAGAKPENFDHIHITPTKHQRTSNVTPATPNQEQSSPGHINFPFGGPPPSENETIRLLVQRNPDGTWKATVFDVLLQV